MSRTLTLDIPEQLYRALAAIAAREGLSPEAVGTSWLVDAITQRASDARSTARRLEIVWEGPVFDLHSFSQVNRELCLGLIARGHDLTLIASKPRDAGLQQLSGREALEAHCHREPRGPITAHIRHQWPPSFTPPPAGHWVIMQPWEFGSIPQRWVEPMCALVDEVWAYSRFVRNCYIKGGVPAEGPCRTARNRPPALSPGGRAFPAQDRQAIPVSVRGRHDPPQGH